MPTWMLDFTPDEALAAYASSIFLGGVTAVAVAFLRALRT